MAAKKATATSVERDGLKWWLTTAIALVAVVGGVLSRIDTKADRSQLEDIQRTATELRVLVAQLKTQVDLQSKNLEQLDAQVRATTANMDRIRTAKTMVGDRE